MRVILYADAGGEDWRELLVQHGFETVLLEPGELPAAMQADVCVVIHRAAGSLSRYRSWIGQITLPILLITTAISSAQALQRHTQVINLICHPSSALGNLSKLIAITRVMRSGLLVKDRPAPAHQLFQRADTRPLRHTREVRTPA